MEKTAKLILTDSYFNIFPLLTAELDGKVRDVHLKNLVFCEEKISLMAERWICNELKGSFNTDVYSFGNFLRTKKKTAGILSKEGSAMAVKRILSSLSLKCFRASKTYLAPSLYDLIAQLKSAKVGYADLEQALTGVDGVLKNKLSDITEVYKEYENYLSSKGYEDQSSALSYLPFVIEADDGMADTDVYLLGYTSWTNQARSVVDALLKNARSVTAILTAGENEFLYVNETVFAMRDLCRKNGVSVIEKFVRSDYAPEGKMLADSAFNPVFKYSRDGKFKTDRIYLGSFKNAEEEVMRAAEQIKKAVMSGKYRYRDITVALSETAFYRDTVGRIFDMLDIPYFFDEKKRAENHPLISLIISYVDSFRKNLERDALACFYKNPLVCSDKTLADDFENYTLKYNINYSRIKEPFVFEENGERCLSELEAMRVRICSFFERFDITSMLEKLDVKERLTELSENLKEFGESEQAAVCEQIYDAVIKLIGEMDMMLGDVKLSLTEYKSVFLSGVAAMDLSIIPQYADAVFIGGFKETALAKAKILFVFGLTSAVPVVRNDIALLSDGDIDVLDGVSVLVEPKIRVVNHRLRENAGMAVSAFADRLYLSYPVSCADGKKNLKSELFSLAETLFETKPFDCAHGYLTTAQGVDTFAKECSLYAEGKSADFVLPSSFSVATDGRLTDYILKCVGKQLKMRLNGTRRKIIGGEISATVIEDFYKCPYKAFVSHGLKLKDREDGTVSVLSVGNLMHDILRLYVNGISSVTDKESSDALFYKVAEDIFLNPDYKKFLSEKGTSATLTRVLNECRKYCYKTFLSLSSADFKSKTEVPFGDGEKAMYPSVKLLGGKVRLKGKIDRVDIGEKYFRVVDYKTGGSDAADKTLFSGTKLQLYLYATAVRDGADKIPAGLYYMPISDKYTKVGEVEKMSKGKTLDDEQAISVQDKNFYTDGDSNILPVKLGEKGVTGASSAKGIDSCMRYAVSVAENAARYMNEGVIVPSPYDDVCSYCEYVTLCGATDAKKRTVGKVTEETFINAMDGGTKND